MYIKIRSYLFNAIISFFIIGIFFFLISFYINFINEQRYKVVNFNHQSINKMISSSIDMCFYNFSEIKLKESNEISSIQCSEIFLDNNQFFLLIAKYLNNQGFKNPYEKSESAFFLNQKEKIGRTIINIKKDSLLVQSYYIKADKKIYKIESKIDLKKFKKH